MSYTAKNIQIFTAAFAGCLAGMGLSDRQITDTDAAKYAGLAVTAGAFSQAIDTAWGDVKATTLLSVECMQQACAAYWQDRSPRATAQTSDAASYARPALAIIAAIDAAAAYFAAQGLTPPAIPGGISTFASIACRQSQNIVKFDPVQFDTVDTLQGTLTFDAGNYQLVIGETGFYLCSYTLRAVKSVAGDCYWSFLVNGAAPIAQSQVTVEDSGAADEAVVLLTATFVQTFTIRDRISVSHVTDVLNCGLLATDESGPPAALLSLTLLKAS